MKFSLPLFFFLLLYAGELCAQKIPEGGYHPPMKIPAVLSSNFGELRPNHFHMGIDYKTNNKTGYNLYAIEKGYVSRIKVSPYGYGKVVYIDHPNGITSVYAHCSEFKGKVDSIVRVTQQREQDFAVEIFPKKGEIKVKRGEVFALSGNSGSSTGPHLHFEIRDTKTEAALNPLVFGFNVADNKKPEIRGLKVYSLTQEGYRYPGKATVKTVKKGTKGYYLPGGSITLPASYCSKNGGIGFAFDVIDRLDAASNRCGLYGSILIINGDTIFGQQTDRVPFESTRYVNSHKDYEEYSANRKKFHKCFRTTENDLPIYRYGENGVYPARPGDVLDVKYVAYDPKGNKSTLSFKVTIAKGAMNTAEIAPGLDYLHPSYPMKIQSNARKIEFGSTTVYEPLKLSRSKAHYSIGQPAVPVHKPYRIHIKSGLKNDGKNYIRITTNKGRSRALDVGFKDGWFFADSKYFGTYKLVRDTIAPKITPSNFTSRTTSVSGKKLTWKISETQSGIDDYDLFIDGKWHLLEFDSKSRLLIFNRPEGFTGTKKLLLKAVDDCGNVRKWEKTLTFN